MSDRMFNMAMRDLQQIKYSEILEQNANFRSQLLDKAEEIRTLTTQRDMLVKALEEVGNRCRDVADVLDRGEAYDTAGFLRLTAHRALVTALSQTKEGV